MTAKARILIFLFSLGCATSCAFFVNRFDDNRLSQDILKFKGEDKPLYCEKKNSLQLVNSSRPTQEAFVAFLSKVSKEKRISFVDQAVLWSLIQMNLRPDLASPTSKLQLFIKNNGSMDYFHFYSKEKGATPYLSGLDALLKKYKSKNSLLSLATLVDKHYPNVFLTGKNFEQFLKARKAEIASVPSFKNYYMRADETLQENEKIYKYPLAPLVKRHSDKSVESSLETSSSLFTYETPTKSMKAHCNYDMKLYSNSVYLIHKDFIKSHLFGIQKGGDSFLASATQRLEKLAPFGRSPFFEGSSQTRSAALCAFEKTRNKSFALWTASSYSRDPGQHIFHMIEQGIDETQGLPDISKVNSFARHLFLEDPTRLVFESNRSSKEQLERLLKLNLPIYNARKLGHVTSYLDGAGFVIDERRDGEITCK